MTARYKGEAFRERFGPWAVIAGGSDGIGAAFAEILVARGINVMMIARNEAKLAAKVAEIKAKYTVEVRGLCADLTSLDIAERVSKATSAPSTSWGAGPITCRVPVTRPPPKPSGPSPESL